jgi:phospholipid/cholesterol/gamma-HCH transport system substrate-binding protein
MESRANYVAVGAFVLAMAAAILVATLWLAQAQLQAHYALFEMRVSGSVSGLDLGAPVRMNGIDIGQVAEIEQDVQDPALVNVLLRVREPARIHADSVASQEIQGLTGGSYIEITGGTAASPLLAATAVPPYPIIASRASGLQQVVNNAPLLLTRLNTIADELQLVVNDQNRRAITEMLTNLRDISATLDRRTQDIDQLIVDGGHTMHNLAAASDGLNALLAHLDKTSTGADHMVATADNTLDQATKLAVDLQRVVQSSQGGIRELTTTVPARLDELLVSANRLTQSLDRVSTGLERDPSRVLFGVRDQGYRPK